MEIQQSEPTTPATLAAQALQIPALSESALLLLKSLRETAEIGRAPDAAIIAQNDSSDSDVENTARTGTYSTTGADMNHEEKVKVLRALYANRTRNKVSSSDIEDEGNKSDDAGEERSNEEQQQRRETTSEKRSQEPMSASEDELRTTSELGNDTEKVRLDWFMHHAY